MPYAPFPTSDTENSFTIRGPFQLPSSDYNQAIAELDAREANPRSGIPDDQFKQLTLERALADQLSPFNVGLAMGAEAVAPISTGRNFQYSGFGGSQTPIVRKVGSDEYQYDRRTGKWEKVIDAPDKPLPLDDATKSRKALLEARIKHERNLILSAPENEPTTWKPLIDQALRDEEELKQLLEPKLTASAFAPPAAPRLTMRNPQTAEEAASLYDGFGGPGQRTPFMFSGAAAPPPVAPVRRRRWNPATGRFE